MATGPTRFEQKDGTVTWRVRWNYGGKREGARQQVFGLTFADAKILKREVEARRHLIRSTDPEVADRSIIRGRPTAAEQRAAISAMTWGQAGAAFIASRDVQAASTKQVREKLLRNNFTPWLDRPIEDLTPTDARRLLAGLRERSLSTASTHQLGTSIGKWLVAQGFLTSHPFRDVPRDRKPTFRGRFLTVAEAEVFLTHLPDENYRLAFQTILESGLRRGELIALQTTDLRRQGPHWVLNVDKTVTTADDGHGQKIGPVKTKASERILAIPFDLGEALYDHARKHGQPYLFPGPDGDFIGASMFTSRFKEALTACNAEGSIAGNVRVHDLRHTHGSRLLNSPGVTLLAVSRRLGHASTDITSRIYGHVDPLQDEVILGALVAARHAR